MAPLTAAEREALLAYARRAVERAVRAGRPDPDPPAGGPFARRDGAFVTLRRREGGELRGCMGRLPGSPLGESLAAMAHAAAREDPRFPPVGEGELPGVSVEVSLLGPFAAAADPLSVLRVGVHGVRVRRGERGGLLLPQVGPEQGWDAAALLEAACRKAGLPPDAWREPGTGVELFTAEVLGPV